MATLLNKQTQQTIILRVNHTFGRDAGTNITQLQGTATSRNHASLAWDGEVWRIKDASSNGTFLNKKRIANGIYNDIPLGADIQFGSLLTEIWKVIDLNPPTTGLIPLTEDLPFIALHDVVVLPIEEIDIMIYLSEDAQWLCEIDEGSLPLHPGDKVGYDGKFWQFEDPQRSTATTTMLPHPPNDIKFLFNVSQNEEHVSLKLIINNHELDMGERNHHYLLLLLARQRLEDNANGLTSSEQGWIKKDLLVKMTGIIEQHINIQIYRFRKQVATLTTNATKLHQIIERRPGELRFAYTEISIEGGFNLLNTSI